MIRHDWNHDEVQALFEEPFADLLFQAQNVHRQHFNANEVQLSTLLSIKTGACPEDCGYCSQSGHNNTNLKKEKLLSVDAVITAAKKAKANNATRFCMGAAWRTPPAKDLPKVIEMIKAVKALGLECCATLGILSDEQVQQLEDAELDYYNHNIDTSEQHFEKISQTRKFQDRLDTVARIRQSKINTCCGGIMGMGETISDRIEFLRTLANMPEHPNSVPINMLVKIEGTPLENCDDIDAINFVKIIAVARILMPKSYLRLSGGRNKMSESTQALAFLAGANSIHFGEKLLTTPLPRQEEDLVLLTKLGMKSLIPKSKLKVNSQKSVDAIDQ